MIYDANQNWVLALDSIIALGEKVHPRNIPCKEILNYQMWMWMDRPIISIPERKLGTAFLCAEPAWILSGDNTLDFINKFADMKRFSDDGIFLSGAYAPKIMDQIPYVVKCLRNDSFSRQAVINIWREKPGHSFDIPCSVCYQFFIRKNILHMVVTMRSQDIWTGNVYDIFTQSMVALAVCLLLRPTYPKLELGMLTLNVGSLHLYQTNIEAASEILAARSNNGIEDSRLLKYDYGMSFYDLKDYLKDCAETLLKKQVIQYGFLTGLEPKNG